MALTLFLLLRSLIGSMQMTSGRVLQGLAPALLTSSFTLHPPRSAASAQARAENFLTESKLATSSSRHSLVPGSCRAASSSCACAMAALLIGRSSGGASIARSRLSSRSPVLTG